MSSNILYETANGVFVFSSNDLDALQRSVEGSSVMRCVSLIGQLPFSSSDEATQYNMSLQEGQIPELTIQWLQTIVGKGRLLVQDGRLLKQLQTAGFQPEFNADTIEVFRKIRAFQNALIQTEFSQNFSASLALCHSTSRSVCQFDKNRSDAQLMQAIGYYDSLLKDINKNFMRLVESFSLHFPEMKRIVLDNDLYVCVVRAFPARQLIESDVQFCQQVRQILSDAVVPDITDDHLKEIATKVIVSIQTTTGCVFQDMEIENVQLQAIHLIQLIKNKNQTLQYLDEKLQLVAPNLNTLLGPLHAARLIQKAGGLRNLVKASAATVQLYGAEKALFRCLKQRSKKTPKYGILFNCDYLNKCAHPKLKGRVARALACSASRCSRVDMYASTRDDSYGKVMKFLVQKRVEYYNGARKTEPMLRTMDVVNRVFQNKQ